MSVVTKESSLKIFRELLSLFLSDRISRRFAIGSCLGFSFSIAVILATIGIMDGFGVSLKKGLRATGGDITIYSREGFFSSDSKFLKDLDDLNLQTISPYIQTEAFALSGDNSRGVLVRGVDSASYPFGQERALELGSRQLIIGSELARVFDIAIGDSLSMLFASGKTSSAGLPTLEQFEVVSILHHGVHQSDLRLIFAPLKDIQMALGLGDQVNMVVLQIESDSGRASDSALIEDTVARLRLYLGPGFSVSTYWSEFSFLLNVVQVEKVWIGLILQVIVVISLFNVLAFIIFVNDQKGRELFLFKALGLSQVDFVRLWYGFLACFWILTCLISILLVQIFDWMLGSLSVLNVPADVYQIGKLSLEISYMDYTLVFCLALFWLFFISWFGLRRLKTQSILYGLRKEFA
jgi:ABC-type lipoprotein release transport system permease subunit